MPNNLEGLQARIHKSLLALAEKVAQGTYGVGDKFQLTSFPLTRSCPEHVPPYILHRLFDKCDLINLGTERYRNRMKYSDSEAVYADEWAKENERVPWLNSGYTLLEWLLSEGEYPNPEKVTQRDALVAASFAQWLGTNCGRGFIDKCERRIKELTQGKRELRDLLTAGGQFENKDMPRDLVE